MRRLAAFTAVALVVLAILWSCSKKSSPPTAPPPPPDPACGLSTTTLSFGTVTLGSNTDRTFTLTNTGGGTLSGAVSESSPDFAVTNTPAYSLAAGQAATFTVRFTPTSAEAKACTLQTGSALCGVVLASGVGQVATPVCDVQTTTLDFGTLLYGRTAIRRTAIQNAGSGTLSGTISGASVDFTFLDSPSFSLGPGQWANTDIQFKPSKAGTQVCTLKVSPPGCAPIVCIGRGELEYHNHCNVSVTSGVVDFGDVGVGATAERDFTLRNSSSSYVARGSMLDQCPEFDCVEAYDILPNSAYIGSVRFTPTRLGPQECAVPVRCWMDGSGTNPGVRDYLICRGNGVGGAAQCGVSTNAIDMGTVFFGQTKDTTLRITNLGSATLSGTVSFLDNSPPFSLVGPASYALGPGANQDFTVRFTSSGTPGHTYTYVANLATGTTCSAQGLDVQVTAVAAQGP